MHVLYTTLVVSHLANIRCSPNYTGIVEHRGLQGRMTLCYAGSPEVSERHRRAKLTLHPQKDDEGDLEVVPEGVQEKGQEGTEWPTDLSG